MSLVSYDVNLLFQGSARDTSWHGMASKKVGIKRYWRRRINVIRNKKCVKKACLVRDYLSSRMVPQKREVIIWKPVKIVTKQESV